MTTERQYECESKLIYSLICAGKSADFSDKALRNFIIELARLTNTDYYVNHGTGDYTVSQMPLAMVRQITPLQLDAALRKARTGNYNKLLKALVYLAETDVINWETLRPHELEKCHGIGPKTSRFFIMWIRPDARYAALDVHILRWLRNKGYDVPKATPQSRKRYSTIEKWFLDEAAKAGKTPRELDYEIWMAGAGRTQETATPV